MPRNPIRSWFHTVRGAVSSALRARGVPLVAAVAAVVVVAAVSAFALVGSPSTGTGDAAGARDGGRTDDSGDATGDERSGSSGDRSEGAADGGSAAGSLDEPHPSADDEGDPVLAGPLGVVVAGDATATDVPGPVPAAPVALDPVEPFAPPVVPPAEPTTVDVLEGPAFGPGGPGSLIAEGTACQLDCIERATLHRELRSTDVRVELETSVRTRMYVGVSTLAPIQVGNDLVLPSAISDERVLARTAWETTLSGLEPDTTYHVLVRAKDLAGGVQFATTTFRTVTPVNAADQLVANPAGCSYQCISSGVVTSMGHDRAALHVESSIPARLSVSVSTQEPGWIGGSPVLPSELPVAVPGDLRTSWDLEVGGLAPATTYHVVVRATDAEDRYSSRIGTFTTPEEPPTVVQVTFREIGVEFDGDAGNKGAGELSFAWGSHLGTLGIRNVADIGDGERITLHDHHTTQLAVEPGAIVPPFYVSAAEFDRPQSICWAENLHRSLRMFPEHEEHCNVWINVATSGLLSVDAIASMSSCAAFGVIGDGEDDRCQMLMSEDLGDRHPRFWALVSYEVL